MKKILTVIFLSLGLATAWTSAMACDCDKNKGAASEDSQINNKAAENDKKEEKKPS